MRCDSVIPSSDSAIAARRRTSHGEPKRTRRTSCVQAIQFLIFWTHFRPHEKNMVDGPERLEINEPKTSSDNAELLESYVFT
jgi:hypothetical protein